MNNVDMYQICQNRQKCVSNVKSGDFDEISKKVHLLSCSEQCIDFTVPDITSLVSGDKTNGLCTDKCCSYKRRVCKRISKKRDRAPSRICLRKIDSLFHKRGRVKANVKSYIKYNVPYSSAMKEFVYASFRVEILNRVEHVCFSYLKYRLNMVNLHNSTHFYPSEIYTVIFSKVMENTKNEQVSGIIRF